LNYLPLRLAALYVFHLSPQIDKTWCLKSTRRGKAQFAAVEMKQQLPNFGDGFRPRCEILFPIFSLLTASIRYIMDKGC